MKKILMLILFAGLVYGQTTIKISALPATNYASANDLFIVNQNNVTKKVKFGDFWNSIIDSVKKEATGLANVTIYANTAPTLRTDGNALVGGDLWIDADDNYHQYRWNGTSWVDIRDLVATDWAYLGNIPSFLQAPSGKGLYITTGSMGYYDSLGWKTYIDNTGNFYFGGDSTNYISWNGTALDIRGSLNADDINAGTLTGLTFRTSASGQRIVMDNSNTLSFYDSYDALVGTISGVWASPKSILDITSNGIIDITTSTYTRINGNVVLGTVTGGTWQGDAIDDTYISSASTWNAKLSSSSSLNPANVSQTSSYRFVTDTEKSTWNGKYDANTVGEITINYKDWNGNNQSLNLLYLL
jgi:hypothetical protein